VGVQALTAEFAIERLDERIVGRLAGIAADVGHLETYVRSRIGFALLSPRIQQAILTGQQPADLTSERLARTNIPQSWSEQERLFGFG